MSPYISVAAAPVIFLVCAYFTKPSRSRIGIALLGGVIFAAGNVGWDVIAALEGLWIYPDGSRPLYYFAAGLAFAGVSLLAWRVNERFGLRGLVAFIVVFSLYGLARDIGVSRLMPGFISFGAGTLPWLADFAAWLSLATLSIVIQSASSDATKRSAPVS